jgi:Tat protein secretion system quality control protein TatD with DNase activity
LRYEIINRDHQKIVFTEKFLLEKQNKMPYGLVHIRYSDKKLLALIQKWTKEYLKENNIGGA